MTFFFLPTKHDVSIGGNFKIGQYRKDEIIIILGYKCSSVVERLPSVCETLGFDPSGDLGPCRGGPRGP